MNSSHRARRLRSLVGCAFLSITALTASLTAHAEARRQVLSVDLPALIEKVARSPSRFAVDVPYTASPTTAGEWTASGSRTTWRHSAQIPGAVSISFHASHVALPAGATFTVTANGARYVYTSADINGGELWSRIARGDTLSFELDVATADASRVQLDIVSLQAGYRGLGVGMPNHPRYNQMHILAAAAESCSENWDCRKTPANAGAGQATAALVIRNVAQCTGTLLNDVPGDGKPYMLTARHCQNGDPDGGSPGAAADVTVYWNAISVCGTTLGQIYDSGITRQAGATTMVDQQDAWLIRLNASPVVDDAYYAGWDATGAAFVGGFTAHHALGSKRQFIGWYGQASYNVVSASTLKVGYESTFWATVNAVGNGGPGASGSGLFDDNSRLVGVLVRGRSQSDDEDSPGICPSTPPSAPTLQNSSAWSTALSGIFSSTADPKSSTGTATIQSVLDPANTGIKVVNGKASPVRVTVTSQGNTSMSTGNLVTLEWQASNATSCTASGGESADGWSGPLATTGSKQITGLDGGNVTYTVTCTDGTTTGTAQTSINWVLGTPSAWITVYARTDFGVPFELRWGSNLRNCKASGGKPGDGWSGTVASSGTLLVTEFEPGQVTFNITCGTGDRTATNEWSSYVLPPSVNMNADATSLRIGQPVSIATSWIGGPCTRTGGAAGDGWSDSTMVNYRPVTLSETVPGTYTYTTKCGSGSYVATAQVNVTFTNDAPTATITPSQSTAAAGQMLLSIAWTANVRPCSIAVAGPATNGFFSSPQGPSGSIVDTRNVLGRYTYTVVCGSGANATQASATVDWTGTPKIQFNAPLASVAGQSFYVGYSTNVLPCTATGGATEDGWAGHASQQATDVLIVEKNAGTYTFDLACTDGTSSVQAQTKVKILAEAPRATLTATPTLQLVGKPVTLTWTSNTSTCSASGSGAPGWSGELAGSGSITVTENSPVARAFSLICGSDQLYVYLNAYVSWQTHVPPALTASATNGLVGKDITLQWASADGASCTASGGVSGDGWAGSKPASGTAVVRSTSLGSIQYGLACGGSDPSYVWVYYDVPQATAKLTTSATSTTTGTDFTLTWTTENTDNCTADGGTYANGWTGVLNASGGSKSVRETAAGSYMYTINCTGSNGLSYASASANVTVTAPPAPPTNSGDSSGGGGGGGSMSLLDVGGLGAVLLFVLRVRRRERATP